MTVASRPTSLGLYSSSGKTDFKPILPSWFCACAAAFTLDAMLIRVSMVGAASAAIVRAVLFLIPSNFEHERSTARLFFCSMISWNSKSLSLAGILGAVLSCLWSKYGFAPSLVAASLLMRAIRFVAGS